MLGTHPVFRNDAKNKKATIRIAIRTSTRHGIAPWRGMLGVFAAADLFLILGDAIQASKNNTTAAGRPVCAMMIRLTS